MLPLGFRHAATLLLTKHIRGIAQNAPPDETGVALRRLADDLVALAKDMRMPPEAGSWLRDEYLLTIARLQHAFDTAAAQEYANRVFANIGQDLREGDRRHLFIVYVPEDRLPVAAPLAIALTKRRLSVAFSGYEVAARDELVTAVAEGLARHTAGLVLATPAFERAGLLAPIVESDRLRVLTANQAANDVEDVVRWARALSKL